MQNMYLIIILLSIIYVGNSQICTNAYADIPVPIFSEEPLGGSLPVFIASDGVAPFMISCTNLICYSINPADQR